MMKETEKMTTGVEGLDRILHGGIIRGSSILLEGRPGTGKSILGMQFLAAGVRQGEAGLLLSFEVKPRNLYRDAAAFGWDMRQFEQDGLLSIILASIPNTIEQLQTPNSPLERTIIEMRVRRIVIDSITMLEQLYPSFQERRLVSMAMLNALNRLGLTSLIIMETTPQSPMVRSSVDSIWELTNRLYEHRDYTVRRLRIRKVRGQNFISGNHSFRIKDKVGIELFPRIGGHAPQESPQMPSRDARLSLGVSALDEMLNGGVFAGTATMVAGATGTGKSLLGLQFMLAGIQAGEKVLIFSLEEDVEQIIRNAQPLGFDLRTEIKAERLKIVFKGPAELDLNEHVGMILSETIGQGYSRVLVDSMSAYRTAARNPVHFRDVLVTMLEEFRLHRISSILTNETHELGDLAMVTEDAVSTFVDNIILLRYLEVNKRLSRALMVLKTRGSGHTDSAREFRIGEGGIHIEQVDASRVGMPFFLK